MSAFSSIERLHHNIRELPSPSSVVSDRSSSPQLTLDSSPAESVDSSLECDKWFSTPEVEGGYIIEEPTLEELFAQLDLVNFFDSELCLEDRARIVISLIPTFLESPYAFRPHSGTKPEDIPNSFNATIALVFDVLTELQSEPGRYESYVQAIQVSPFQVNDILRVVALGAYSSPIHYLALPFPVLYPTSSTEIFAFLTTKFDSITLFQPDSSDNIDYNIQSPEPISTLTSTIEAALTVSPNYSEFSFYPTSLDNTTAPSTNFNSPQFDSSISQFLQELVPLPNVSSIEEELLTIDPTTYSSGDIDSIPIMTWAQTPKQDSPKSLSKPKRVKSNTPKKPSKIIDPSRRIVKCPYENCFHRYTHTSGVKYHLEKCEFRPGAVPAVKPFPCLVPGCRKSYKSTSGRKYHLKKFHNDFLEESAMVLSDGGSDDEDQPSKEALESELSMGNLPSELSFPSTL